jgi:hypothetical protein
LTEEEENMIQLKLIGNNEAEFHAQLIAFAALVRPVKEASPAAAVEVTVENLSKLNLDDLLKLVRVVFDREGYEVTVAERKGEAMTPEPSPGPARKGKARAAKGDGADVSPDKGNSEDQPQASEAEVDRKWSLELLQEMFGDPKRKAKAMSFTSKISKANGGARVSNLPVELFSAIRKQLEEEFGGL